MRPDCLLSLLVGLPFLGCGQVTPDQSPPAVADASDEKAFTEDPGSEDGKQWSEDDTLWLDLEALQPLPVDLQDIKLKLTVTNLASKSIVLDKECSAGFSLRFKTDLSQELIFSDENDVSTKELQKLSKPAPDVARNRFVELQPKKTFSRVFDLSQAVRTVREGHGTYANGAHVGFYYEAEVQYLVPPKVNKLFIDAWYERGVMMAWPQFKDWFGVGIDELGVWSGRARSNTVVVERK